MAKLDDRAGGGGGNSSECASETPNKTKRRNGAAQRAEGTHFLLFFLLLVAMRRDEPERRKEAHRPRRRALRSTPRAQKEVEIRELQQQPHGITSRPGSYTKSPHSPLPPVTCLLLLLLLRHHHPPHHHLRVGFFFTVSSFLFRCIFPFFPATDSNAAHVLRPRPLRRRPECATRRVRKLYRKKIKHPQRRERPLCSHAPPTLQSASAMRVAIIEQGKSVDGPRPRPTRGPELHDDL